MHEAKGARRRPLLVWSVALAASAALVSIGFHGFVAVRWVLTDVQAFSRWELQTVEADKATIETAILPAIKAYARREGRLPADLQRLVAAGDLASIPASRAGVWMYHAAAQGFTIGVGDPPHDYPCAYRVIELRAPNDADPDGWRVRNWYHDS